MRWLAFLSRVAFICDLFFVLAVVWQWLAYGGVLLSSVVMLGYVLAPLVFSPLCMLAYGVVYFSRGAITFAVPRWLVFSNSIFFAIQLIFALFFLHDPFHS